MSEEMASQYSDHDRVVRLETQMARVLSDIDSEKGTRGRINDDFRRELEAIREGQTQYAKENRSEQEKTNKIVWMGLGGIATLQIVLGAYQIFHK